MAEIIRNRTIRPSRRLEKSKSYKVDTKQVSRHDILIVNIDHESKSFRNSYRFNGTDVEHKDSISFRFNDNETLIDISWSGAKPISIASNFYNPAISINSVNATTKGVKLIKGLTTFKKSFEPVSNAETCILILGSMSGDKSLELSEYYGHSRNRFWKIISTITNHDLPLTYPNKKTLLFQTKIGLWDVAHKANRMGSLDSNIKDEEPNEWDNFISLHKNLKVIGFNGTKSEKLFDKYFTRKTGIKYILLPSSCPANTSIDFANICNQWQQLLQAKD